MPGCRPSAGSTLTPVRSGTLAGASTAAATPTAKARPGRRRYPTRHPCGPLAPPADRPNNILRYHLARGGFFSQPPAGRNSFRRGRLRPADGRLRPTAWEAGFKYPVALTAAAWVKCVAVPSAVKYQDEAGRLWDVLTMLRLAVRGQSDDAQEARFGVHVRNDNRDRTHAWYASRRRAAPATRASRSSA